QGHRGARRVLRERTEALQEAVREGRAHVGAAQAAALREAQRQAEAEEARGAEEDKETRAVLRLVSGGNGVEWAQVQGLLALDTHTPMGRERALGLEPSTDLPQIQAGLGQTRQSRIRLGADL